MTELGLGRAIGALILAMMIGITCALLVPKGPRPVPAVPMTTVASAPLPPIPPEPEPIIITPEPPHPTLCEGLGEKATLACVLRGPDLDSYSDDVLEKADSAAYAERLALEASTPSGRDR